MIEEGGRIGKKKEEEEKDEKRRERTEEVGSGNGHDDGGIGSTGQVRRGLSFVSSNRCLSIFLFVLY